MDSTPVFYSRAKGSVIDLAVQVHGVDDLVTTIGVYGREGIDQLRERYPDIEILPFDEAAELQEKAAYERYKGVKEISRNDYIEALCMMPPLKQSVGFGAESFRMSEARSGLLHAGYVALAYGTTTRYFCLIEPVTLTHVELVKKVKAALEAGEVQPIAA
jgi:hypothetical protein